MYITLVELIHGLTLEYFFLKKAKYICVDPSLSKNETYHNLRPYYTL